MYTFPPILIFTPDCVKLVFNYFLPDMYKLLYVDCYQSQNRNFLLTFITQKHQI
jgi:hypothetical protein